MKENQPVIQFLTHESRTARHDGTSLVFMEGLRYVAELKTPRDARWNDLMLAWCYSGLPWNGLCGALAGAAWQSFNPLDEELFGEDDSASGPRS